MADPDALNERIVAEALSRFGSIRVTITFADQQLVVERRHPRRTSSVTKSITVDSQVLDALRELALKVSQDEQKLLVGDFYADGEERLWIELAGHRVELHNRTARIRTPAAELLLRRCYDLSDAAR